MVSLWSRMLAPAPSHIGALVKSLRFTPLLLFCLAVNASAEDAAVRPKDRPRIGVALGGGGALGLAHIGVLRYFEEHHIPVDAMAGTSMGGLVGGLYATGMKADELEAIVSQADWDALLAPIPSMRDQPIVEKQAWNRSFGNLNLRHGKKFALPEGLNPGEALALVLSRYTAAYGGISSFDELPIPFRCVATDLISGEPIVLDHGSLAKALRTTMAIPAVFTPVVWGDMLLVDGGIVENLPVEPLRSMGASKTIAVRLLGPAAKANQFRSLTNIARRSITVSIEQNEKRSEKLADLVIRVDTAELSGTDYSQYRRLIAAGYGAAKARASELRQFEVTPEQWAEFISTRDAAIRSYPHRGTVTAVTAKDSRFERNAKLELERKLGQHPVSEQKLSDTLSEIVSETGVPSASYEWDAKSEGYAVEFLPRPEDRMLIRPSFRYGFSSGEPSRTELQLAMSITPEHAYKSKILGAATVGYDPGIRGEYYHPFGVSAYFVAFGGLIRRTHFDTYEGTRTLSRTRDRYALSSYAGIGTWRHWHFRVGAQSGHDSYSSGVETDGVIAKSQNFTNPELTWVVNTFDSGGFTQRGTRIDGALGYSFQNKSFPYLRTDFARFRTPTPHFTLFYLGDLDTSFGRKLNFYEQFTAGGSGALSAFRYQEFHSDSMIIGGGGVLIHTRLRSPSLHPDVAFWYEAGGFDPGAGGWQTHRSANSGIFLPTRWGAVGMEVGMDENGARQGPHPPGNLDQMRE